MPSRAKVKLSATMMLIAYCRVFSLQMSSWPELSAVLNPAEYLTSQLESATFHDLKVSQLKLPSAKTDNEIVSFPPPRNVFQLFKNGNIGSLPPYPSI